MARVQTLGRASHWYLVPVRVLLVTFIVGLLWFALSLLVGILAVVMAAVLRGLKPNMTIAYRGVAFPSAAIMAGIVLICSSYVEIRAYRQSKALESIEHQMGT